MAVITPELSHIHLIRSGGPLAHLIEARCSALRLIERTTIGHVTYILKTLWNLVPHGENEKKQLGLKQATIQRIEYPFGIQKAEHYALYTI